jgi:hypothetical protein
VAVAAASAVSFWGAARRRWHVPSCGGAIGTLLGGDAAGTQPSGGAAVEETLGHGSLKRTKQRFAPIS